VLAVGVAQQLLTMMVIISGASARLCWYTNQNGWRQSTDTEISRCDAWDAWARSDHNLHHECAVRIGQGWVRMQLFACPIDLPLLLWNAYSTTCVVVVSTFLGVYVFWALAKGNVIPQFCSQQAQRRTRELKRSLLNWLSSCVGEEIREAKV
jgi:hypothetical protein